MPTPKVKIRKKPTNKRCEKGYPCKTTCISREKNCKEPLKGQAATLNLWLKHQEEMLEITNKKRAKVGLTPARMTEYGYITAERTKLPQSAKVEKAIAVPESKPVAVPQPEKIAPKNLPDPKSAIAPPPLTPTAKALTEKLSKAKAEFNALVHDPKARNIAFGAAGNLSKGSKSFHNRHREKLGKKAIEIARLERAIKIEKGEPFTIPDVDSAMKDINPLPDDFINSSTPLFRAAELIRQSFGNTHRAILRKDILLDFNTLNGVVWKVTPNNKVTQAYTKESAKPQDLPEATPAIADSTPTEFAKSAIAPAIEKPLAAIRQKHFE